MSSSSSLNSNSRQKRNNRNRSASADSSSMKSIFGDGHSLSPFLQISIAVIMICFVLAFSLWLVPEEKLKIVQSIIADGIHALETFSGKFISQFFDLMNELMNRFFGLISRCGFRLLELMYAIGNVYLLGIRQLYSVSTLENFAMLFMLTVVFVYIRILTRSLCN